MGMVSKVKVGDLVTVKVPPVIAVELTGSQKVCYGMVVDKKVMRAAPSLTNTTWFFVLRSDNGKVEKFHANWLEAGENGSW